MASAKMIRVFHAVCAKKGLTKEDKESLLIGYGVASSKDLKDLDIIEIIKNLETDNATTSVEKRDADNADTWRKRVMAAIGAWLRLNAREENANYIKAIACNATGYTDFNKIPVAQLRNVYYEFVNKNKVAKNLKNITDDILKDSIQYN